MGVSRVRSSTEELRFQMRHFKWGVSAVRDITRLLRYVLFIYFIICVGHEAAHGYRLRDK